MFNFFDMVGNYEERKVDRYESGFLVIDTAAVTDSEMPFETAVQHPKYNYGKWVIVETYMTKELAQEGHNRWVGTMTAEQLPDTLTDVSTAGVAQLLDIFSEGWREQESA